MDKESTPESRKIRVMNALFQSGSIPVHYQEILKQFYEEVHKALVEANRPLDSFDTTFIQFLRLVIEQFQSPFVFQPYHAKIRAPFDYYRFSLDFIRPLIDLTHSKVKGLKIASQIEQ